MCHQPIKMWKSFPSAEKAKVTRPGIVLQRQLNLDVIQYILYYMLCHKLYSKSSHDCLVKLS